jgi:hypothetical protein
MITVNEVYGLWTVEWLRNQKYSMRSVLEHFLLLITLCYRQGIKKRSLFGLRVWVHSKGVASASGILAGSLQHCGAA